MKDEKLETISNLFEEKEIRSIWNAEKEEGSQLHENNSIISNADRIFNV